MPSDDVGDIGSGLFLFGAIVGFVAGVVFSLIVSNLTWKADAIQHKAAYYDQVTGEFQWNEAIQEANR